ncbi:MAG: tetratricopeptide repeat protein [Bacteroidetes bacterium]|nr:tetratricopeptide repeat protein [Bacteroidota bacterium]
MKKCLTLFLFSLPFLCFSQTIDSTIVRQVDSFLTISTQLWRAGKLTDAEPIALQAREIAAQKLGSENTTYANCLHHLARVYLQLGDLKESITAGEGALRIRGKLLGKSHPDYAKTLNNLCVAYKEAGVFDKAEAGFKESLHLKELATGKEDISYSTALYGLANVYMVMGKQEEAIPYILECLDIREKLLGTNAKEYLNARQTLAAIYLSLKWYDDAEPIFLELKTAYKEKEQEQYTGALLNLATLYRESGRFEEALALDNELLKTAESTESPALLANIHNNLSIDYISIGQSEKALLHALASNQFPKKWEGWELSPEYARNLGNLGGIYGELKQYDKAINYMQEAKSTYEKIYGKNNPNTINLLNDLAFTLVDLKRYDEAEKLYKEAIQASAGKMELIHTTLLNLGFLQILMQQYPEAKKNFLTVLDFRGKYFGKENILYEWALFGLHELYLAKGEMEKAAPYALQANTLRKQVFLRNANYLNSEEMAAMLNTHIDKENALVTTAWLGRNEETIAAVYDNALYYKGLSLERNLLLRKILMEGNTSEHDTYLEWTSLQRKLSLEYSKPLAAQKTDSLESSANEVEKKLIRTVAGFGKTLESTDWHQVQSALKPNEVAIEFYHFEVTRSTKTDSVMYAALVLRNDNESPHFIPLFEEKQLIALLNADGNEEQSNWSELYTNDTLYNLIWQPLEVYLKNTSKVWYSPDGLLHRISFSSVPTPFRKRLADQYQLVRLGSTRQLALPKVADNTGNLTDAVFGGIIYDVDTAAMEHSILLENNLTFRGNSTSPLEDWPYLPGTEREAKEVNRLLTLGSYQSNLKMGAEASETAFKRLGSQRPSPKILHIATHGYFSPEPSEANDQVLGEHTTSFVSSEKPLIRSGLILAGANYVWKGNPPLSGKEDGILTAYEISQLDLAETELVVLSACDSGLGDIEGSEGVFGLQRAFKMAGVKYIIMSLWQAPDQATSDLMGLFYTYFLKDKMTIPDAFNKAQKAIAIKNEDPLYWAGFVLVE